MLHRSCPIFAPFTDNNTHTQTHPHTHTHTHTHTCCTLTLKPGITPAPHNTLTTHNLITDANANIQVSFEEFYILVTDPDPGRPDFGLGPTGLPEAGPAPPGAHLDPSDMPTHQKSVEARMHAMQMKAEKKRLLEQFAKVSGGVRGSEGD